jgi:glycosyltransferase involved in cell wall biosynthesis
VSDPLVSLVMTVWKPRVDWFHEAVRGALAQRGCRFELLVVDDGSPEPVEGVLERFDDPRLRVVRVEHGGLSQARNAGTEASRGELVRFIDADDVIEPESSARLARLIGDSSQTFSYGASLICDEQLRPVWKMTCHKQGHVVVDSLLGRLTVRPHTLMFHRRVLERTGEWRASFEPAEDWDFVTRAAEHAEVRGERRVATFYRRHGASITGNVRANLARAEQAASSVIDDFFERHPERRDTGLERLARARLEAIAARRYATNGDRAEAFVRARRALALDPRALATELAQGVPALLGRARYRLRRPRSVA